MRLGIIFFTSGVMLILFGLVMVIPGLLDYADSSPCANAFWLSSLITCFCGTLFMLCFYDKWEKLSGREMYLTTSLVWVFVCCFCALPFYFAPSPSSYTDSFFEAMSGLTATGATVLTGLEHLPRGLLLWRALMHWIGGFGIIIIAISILPLLRIGGMQLFSLESSDKSAKSMPKTSQIVKTLMLVYVSLTVMCLFALYWSGLTFFDSVTYALSTVSTGGFAPYDDSATHLSLSAQWILIFFMFISGLPLFFCYFLFKGLVSEIKNNLQVRTYCWICFFAVAILSIWFSLTFPEKSFWEGLTHSAFNVIAILTTTGLSIGDPTSWGTFTTMFFFFLLPIGACSGSTTGGIKVFRFNILYLFSVRFLRNKILPHGVFVAKFDGKPVSEDVTSGVLVYIAMFLTCMIISSLLLSFLGLDFLTAISGSLASLSNVGPGVGPIINPSGTFESLPKASKWILSFDMLVGRLEYMTVFVLLLPLTWKKETKATATPSF